jgi:nitroreductase
VWTSKQTYLAGNLLNVAAELKIDVSPMEGFVPEKVNELLIRKVRLYRFSLAPLGYRHDEDATQYYKKLENHKKIYLSQYNY